MLVLLIGVFTVSHVSFNINPEHEFKYELSCIEDRVYRDLATRSLRKVPDYFWIVPASSSGKYHPKSSLGIGGLVRHTKSVFAISEELLKHQLYSPFSNEEKDQIRIAILLHDACKQGTNKEGSYTVPEHPLLVREALDPVQGYAYTDDWSGTMEANTHDRMWSEICDLIETHMGVWNKDKEGKEILDVPKTKAQLHVHMCDYLASRKSIEVDIVTREEQSNYPPKKENKDWRNEIATENQLVYIRKLAVMCNEKNVHNPYGSMMLTDNGKICITKGSANEAIEGMKKVLGI